MQTVDPFTRLRPEATTSLLRFMVPHEMKRCDCLFNRRCSNVEFGHFSRSCKHCTLSIEIPRHTRQTHVHAHIMCARMPSQQHACMKTSATGKCSVVRRRVCPSFLQIPHLSQEAIFSGVTHALYFQNGLSSSSRRRASQSGQFRSDKEAQFPIGSAMNCCPRLSFLLNVSRSLQISS